MGKENETNVVWRFPVPTNERHPRLAHTPLCTDPKAHKQSQWPLSFFIFTKAMRLKTKWNFPENKRKTKSEYLFPLHGSSPPPPQNHSPKTQEQEMHLGAGDEREHKRKTGKTEKRIFSGSSKLLCSCSVVVIKKINYLNKINKQ